jgi:predicted RND superfamily exporter protein
MPRALDYNAAGCLQRIGFASGVTVKLFAIYLPRRPLLVMVVLVVFTALALLGIRRLTIDPSNERLLLRHSDAYRIYQRFLTTFGSDETILVALHDPTRSLLSPPGLAAIRALTHALATTPHVSTVTSLTTIPDVSRLDLLDLTAPPLIAGEMLSDTDIASMRHNDLIIGSLLAADLHTAGFLIVPDTAIHDQPETRHTWIATVRAVAAQHATAGRRTYVGGTPLERHDVTAYLQRDQQRIVPVVFGLLVGLTCLLYRVKRLALIPLGCVILSLTWAMGVVGFTDTPLHLITSLLPPVIMVVSVSTAIHLLNHCSAALLEGLPLADAIEQAMRRVGIACGLTSLTTALGFFSLLVSPVPAVREFAGFAGCGVLLSLLAAFLFVPWGLSRLGAFRPERLRHLHTSWLTRRLSGLTDWIATRRRVVFLGTAIALIGLLPGMWYLHEGTDIVRALPPHAPLRVSTEFLDQHLTGTNALEILIRLPGRGKRFDAPIVRQVLEFAQWLRQQPGITSVQSPWEPLRLVPAEVRTDDTQFSHLATLMPLQSPLRSWLHTTTRTLRLSAQVRAMESNRFLALAQHVQEHAAQVSLSIEITGTNYLLALMSRQLVTTQVYSVGLAVVLILGCITLALRSWQLGLLAAIPNVLPPLMIFGLMGWSDIPLSTATTMIASVALGLIVDDTIHLLYRYRHERQAGHVTTEALRATVRETGRALIFTTLILTLGFWAGILGSFQPTVFFSFLTGLTMVLALLADLLLAPALLLTWERKRTKEVHD